MAKQKSTVELVYEALEAKGWLVDDVELDRGAITVTATAPDGEQLIDSFKQAAARKWLDGVRDVTPVQAEAELTVEEWEAQYGHVTDDDVAQALAPEAEIPEALSPVVAPMGFDACRGCTRATGADCSQCSFNTLVVEEPVAEAAPETHEGEMTMDSKLFGCEMCGAVIDEAGLCEDCARGVAAVAAKEDALYEQYLSVREPYFDENPDLAMVFEAMTFRRFLVVRYQTDYEDGTSIIRERKMLPSHVFQAKSTDGICVVAYNVYEGQQEAVNKRMNRKPGTPLRKEDMIQTFRIDKFRACRLGECAPEPSSEGFTLYPAAYEIRMKTPMRVKNPANYIASGKWSSKPLPQVLMQ